MSLWRSFVELPGEVRNRIYKCVLEDIIRLPDHVAWDDLHCNDRFASYYHLLLSNRAISKEIRSLFERPEILGRLIFYFDDVLDIYQFQQLAMADERFKDAYFVLRATSDCLDKDRTKHWSVEKLFSRQPGYRNASHSDFTGKYGMRRSLNLETPVGTYVGEIPILVKEGSLSLNTQSKDQIQKVEKHYNNYRIWCLPDFDRTMLTGVSWDPPEGKDDVRNRMSSSWLEGKIKDLSFDNYDMHDARYQSAYRNGEPFSVVVGEEPHFDKVARRVWRIQEAMRKQQSPDFTHIDDSEEELLFGQPEWAYQYNWWWLNPEEELGSEQE